MWWSCQLFVALRTLGLICLYFSGPLKLNSTPLRRIAQAFVIATKTKIDVSNVKVPKHIDDAYFRRLNAKKAPKKDDANIFAQGSTVCIQLEILGETLFFAKKHLREKYVCEFWRKEYAIHSTILNLGVHCVRSAEGWPEGSWYTDIGGDKKSSGKEILVWLSWIAICIGKKSIST